MRADVMNKNILRAVRRECKNMYQNYVSANSLPTSRDSIDQNVSGFLRHLWGSTHIEGSLFDKFKQRDLWVYLKILLNYWQMKREIYSTTDKLKMNTTYDVLYSYTHKKFHQFIVIPEIGVLIRMIIDMQGLSEFVSKISNKNHHQYESHLKEIIDEIISI